MKTNGLVKILGLVFAGVAMVWLGWLFLAQENSETPEGFSIGNGRLEATQIIVASRLAGRVKSLLVDEGDYVSEGQVLAVIEFESLLAQRAEAVARLSQAREEVATAKAQVVLRTSEHAASIALLAQRNSEHSAAQRRFQRSEELFEKGFISGQVIDNDRSQMEVSAAVALAAKSNADAFAAAISVAQTQVTAAMANVSAMSAAIDRIESDLRDSSLRAPRRGRVQHLIARAGEVLGAGGRVLSLVDTSDVYMIFFLPEAFVGRVPMGAEVRLVLDAAPSLVIPAKVSFISSVAQFTPKTVETASEREKLMFRVHAQIDPALLLRHEDDVKAGLPGVAWVRVDPRAVWPKHLAVHSW